MQTAENDVVKTGISMPSSVYAEAKKKSLASFGGNVSRYLTHLVEADTGVTRQPVSPSLKTVMDNALEQLCKIYHPTLLPELQLVLAKHPLRERQDKLLVNVLQAFVEGWSGPSLATVSGKEHGKTSLTPAAQSLAQARHSGGAKSAKPSASSA